MFDDVFEEMKAADEERAAQEAVEAADEEDGVYRLDRYRSRPAPPPPPPPQPKRSSIFYFEPRDYPTPISVIWLDDVRQARRHSRRKR